MNEKQIRYKYLTNCLVLFAADFSYLKSLHKPDFDIEFELPSELDIGLSLENLEYLYSHNVLKESQKKALISLRENIISVPDPFWTIEELEVNPLWKKIRSEANIVLNLLDEDSRDYDFSIITNFL